MQIIKRTEGFPPIDYRSPADRRIDRLRTNKANALFVGALIAVVIVVGATIFAAA